MIVSVDRKPVNGGLEAENRLRKAGDIALLLARREASSFFAAIKRSAN